jgi:cob(I)alamin adenosyltransferase
MFVLALKSGVFVTSARLCCRWEERRAPAAMEIAETGCVAAMKIANLA